ncbi:MAG: p24 complex component [Cyphobasidiales sp. Tagirdzhanova-0007]|nr:MAG: p24 complex component [Cyphobasidiales sp. Tagirdzhanova-0007]
MAHAAPFRQSMRPLPTVSNLMLFLLPLLILLLAPLSVHAHTIDIQPATRECFFEDLSSEDKMTVTYQVATGGELDLDFWITDPNQSPLYSLTRKDTGTYSFTATKDNEMSSVTGKTVSFNVHGVMYVEDDGHTAPIEKEIRALSAALEAVKDEQEYIVTRERLHRDTAESTNDRVKWWSISQTLLLVALVPVLSPAKRLAPIKAATPSWQRALPNVASIRTARLCQSMPLLTPLHYPYTPNTSNPYSAEVQRAKEIFFAEVDNQEGWEDQGEKDDVKLEKKAGQASGSGMPMVRGTCIIENATTDAIAPIIQTPGQASSPNIERLSAWSDCAFFCQLRIRRKWDPRFETAWIQRRFSATSYQFYSLGNSPPALAWLINPRDLVGIHQSYIGGKEIEEHVGENKEIILIQTSVIDNERASEQPKRTRMSLTLSAWRLSPIGKDVKLTYLVKVELGGSIPAAMMASVIVDLPTCAGKVRDTYYEYGSLPYVVHTSPTSTRSIHQTEFFSLGPMNPHQRSAIDKSWHLHMTGVAGSAFEIRYDIGKMCRKEGGVHQTVKGQGKDGVSLVDDGNGVISVKIGEKADGQNFEVIVQPHTGSANILMSRQ